jgi:ectoine hydroxylase-related dioxygenase (phytanoyl-CoA dioxygenase family)
MKNLLQQPYRLSPEAIAYYQKNNFVKLKQVLDAPTLAYYEAAITAQVAAQNKENTPLANRDTYGKAFLQVFNLWRHSPICQQLVLSQRLGQIAAQLMQVQGVRIYHDQALYKEAGGGITPWHADQYYWPLVTDKTITAWIPLQAVPLAMGPLEFSAGSQQIVAGRELAIGDDSELQIAEKLRVTDFQHVIEPFQLGEVSFHSGWVFHRAGANQTTTQRKVMTIIYMDSSMRLTAPQNQNQTNDWHTWCPGAKIGEVIDTELNPVVYQS